MRFVLSLAALLVAGALTAHAQVDVLSGQDVPASCTAQCGFASALQTECGDAAAQLGARGLVEKDLVSCLNTICSQGMFSQITECVNCLVADGTAGIDQATGQQFLTTIGTTCGQVGSTVTGSLTATPTATGGTASSASASGDVSASASAGEAVASSSASVTSALTAASAALSSAASSSKALASSASSHSAASHISSAISAASSAAASATSSSAAGAVVAHNGYFAQAALVAAGLVAGTLLL